MIPYNKTNFIGKIGSAPEAEEIKRLKESMEKASEFNIEENYEEISYTPYPLILMQYDATNDRFNNHSIVDIQLEDQVKNFNKYVSQHFSFNN